MNVKRGSFCSVAMGSCVSVHRDSEARFGFRMRSGGSSSSKGRHVSGVTKVEEGGDGPVGGFEHDDGGPVVSGLRSKCTSFGSTHETFYDSRAWLDSDCEDDFFSVNGDFIPSGNSTPNHQIITPKVPKLNENFVGTPPVTGTKPSPRKKFVELLLEAKPDEGAHHKEQAVNGKDDDRIEVNGKPEFPTGTQLPSNSHGASPYASGRKSSGKSSESRSNGNAASGKQETSKTMHCCFPVVAPTFKLDGKKLRVPHRSQNSG